MMNRRIIYLSLLCLVLLIIAGGVYYLGRSRQPQTLVAPLTSSTGPAQSTSAPRAASDDFFWTVTAETIPPPEAQPLKEGVAVLVARVGTGENTLTITSAEVDGAWALLYGETKAKGQPEKVPGSPVVLLAHKSETGWEIFTPGESIYCQLLPQVPERLLSQDDKNYIGCSP
jgi:hypothetical protein